MLFRSKKGNDIKNFEAREFSRIIDKLSAHHTLQDWIPLGEEYLGNFRVVFGDKNISVDACEVFGEDKPDHRILNAVTWLQDKYPTQQVILVTKDINLRIKAKALNMLAEDYETGKIKNIENLYSGVSKIHNIDKDKISLLYEHGSIEPELVGIETPVANHYYILKNGSSSVLSFFNPNTQLLEKLDKRPAYRITPRNAEQVFADRKSVV